MKMLIIQILTSLIIKLFIYLRTSHLFVLSQLINPLNFHLFAFKTKNNLFIYFVESHTKETLQSKHVSRYKFS